MVGRASHEPSPRSGVSVERRNSWEQQPAALCRDAATRRPFMASPARDRSCPYASSATSIGNDAIEARRRRAGCIGESGGGIVRDGAAEVLPFGLVQVVLELEAARVAGGGLPHE